LPRASQRRLHALNAAQHAVQSASPRLAGLAAALALCALTRGASAQEPAAAADAGPEPAATDGADAGASGAADADARPAQGRPADRPAGPTSPASGAAAGEDAAEVPRAAPPVPPGGTSPKRALPDYDGRGDEPTTAGDVALWIPRILFSPLYLVTEYVIRRPLGWLISTAERKQWPSAIANFFVFGPDKKAGIVPTAFLDLGFRSSVGFYAFWDDLLGKDNHLRMHFSTFGASWVQAAVADRIPISKESSLDLRFEAIHRPDQVFHGLGPDSRQFDISRYGIDRLQARPVFETTWWRGSRLSIEGGARYVDFRDDACCSDPSLSTYVANGRLAAPPGYFQGYTAVFERLELTVDTRDARPASQSGLRLETEIEQGSDVRTSNSNWIRYGGSLGGFLDIKNNRTLSLSVTALFVDPLSNGGAIPFTEQIMLGGNGPMRGYLYGRLIDRSAAIATLKYRWPIWVFLDGAMQASLGNVFGPQLQDFRPEKLRVSAALGIETVGAADHTFEFLVGFGTETYETGWNVNSVRLLFGTNRGF